MPAPAPESHTVRVSLVILAVIAAGAALYWLRGILTPLALAVFLGTLALTVDLAATGAVVVLLAAVVLRFFAG